MTTEIESLKRDLGSSFCSILNEELISSNLWTTPKNAVLSKYRNRAFYLLRQAVRCCVVIGFKVFILALLFENHHHHHHHGAVKELGHLLTLPGLTHPEVSSVVFLGSFCLLEVFKIIIVTHLCNIVCFLGRCLFRFRLTLCFASVSIMSCTLSALYFTDKF
jgi:hypothetical protein